MKSSTELQTLSFKAICCKRLHVQSSVRASSFGNINLFARRISSIERESRQLKDNLASDNIYYIRIYTCTRRADNIWAHPQPENTIFLRDPATRTAARVINKLCFFLWRCAASSATRDRSTPLRRTWWRFYENIWRGEGISRDSREKQKVAARRPSNTHKQRLPRMRHIIQKSIENNGRIFWSWAFFILKYVTFELLMFN